MKITAKIAQPVIKRLYSELYAKGGFDLWADGLCNDLHNTEVDMSLIKSIVGDFLACRLLEIEGKENIFND